MYPLSATLSIVWSNHSAFHSWASRVIVFTNIVYIKVTFLSQSSFLLLLLFLFCNTCGQKVTSCSNNKSDLNMITNFLTDTLTLTDNNNTGFCTVIRKGFKIVDQYPEQWSL